MMNALEAMDEMMSANDINMNIAAITPVVLLAYFQARIFRFLFYALLKLGKSREETYSSFRDTLLEIERLLVMRDNPPPPTLKASGQVVSPLEYEKSSVLGSDDLGMLMLLIHELRTTIFRDSRRFSLEVIRSLTEDLAELAGERGTLVVIGSLLCQNLCLYIIYSHDISGSGRCRQRSSTAAHCFAHGAHIQIFGS